MSNLSKNKIKWIRSLQQKKHRDELGLYVVEGEKMIGEALENYKDQIQFLCTTNESAYHSLKFPFEVITVSFEELSAISSLKTPHHSLAVLKKVNLTPLTTPVFQLVLDGIQDPGNMGTILRLADWFGIPEIIASKDTVDIYNSKVVQASMGAIFRINVCYTDLEKFLQNYEGKIYGALLEGKNIYKESLKPEGVLILGNEGRGISEKICQLISNPVTIPRFGEAESLNVSVATGILLSEFFRTK